MVKYQELGFNGFSFHRLIGFPESELDLRAPDYGLTLKQYDGAAPYYALAASQVKDLEKGGITKATAAEVNEIRAEY